MDQTKRIEELEEENANLKRLIESRISKLEKDTLYLIRGELHYTHMTRLRNFMTDEEGIQFLVCPKDLVFNSVVKGPPIKEL